jgi:undecaprenyl-diphosphatase
VIILNWLEFIKYLFLGIVQGITEVLPISSSGHVELVKSLIGIEVSESLVFLILLNTGSLVTLVIIYFKKLWSLIKSFILYLLKPISREDNYDNFIYFSKILVASIPAGIVGLLLDDYIEDWMHNYDILLAGIGLLLTGTVLFFVGRTTLKRGSSYLSWLDILFIGLAQSVAIFPGVSRSGMTTSAALKRGSGINSALNFSFLMYIPISFATLLLSILKFDSSEVSNISNYKLIYYIFAFLGAMLATYIAYRLIFNIFRSGKLKYFSYYCFGIGLLAVFLYIL